MKKSRSFKERLNRIRQKGFYQQKLLIDKFLHDINFLLETKGMTRAALAEELAVSQARVSKIFDGEGNFTVASMVKLAKAVDAKIHLHVTPAGQTARFCDLDESKCSLESGLGPGYEELPGFRPEPVGQTVTHWNDEQTHGIIRKNEVA